MGIVNCNNWPDMEVKVMTDALPYLPPSEQTSMSKMIEERKAKIEAGLLKRNSDLTLILAGIDLYLRYWWDEEEQMWAIQRANPFDKVWQLICYWPPDRIDEIESALREGDMQRYNSPAEYLRYKREKAAKIRDNNEREAEQRLLAVIDNLSIDSVMQFIEVERAMRTGERIRVGGQDADILNRMYDANKNKEPVPDNSPCINPGMHPNIHEHLKGDNHVI